MMSTLKSELEQIIQVLPADATWDDVVYQLYVDGKITLGLSETEIAEPMTRDVFNHLFVRAESAHDLPVDMRNTLIYHPGNMTSLGMIAGVVAAAFAFVFPPISWIAAPIALGAGLLGFVARQKNAWIPILLSVVTIVPFLPMIMK
jgi:hypothetical protein